MVKVSAKPVGTSPCGGSPGFTVCRSFPYHRCGKQWPMGWIISKCSYQPHFHQAVNLTAFVYLAYSSRCCMGGRCQDCSGRNVLYSHLSTLCSQDHFAALRMLAWLTVSAPRLNAVISQSQSCHRPPCVPVSCTVDDGGPRSGRQTKQEALLHSVVHLVDCRRQVVPPKNRPTVRSLQWASTSSPVKSAAVDPPEARRLPHTLAVPEPAAMVTSDTFSDCCR